VVAVVAVVVILVKFYANHYFEFLFMKMMPEEINIMHRLKEIFALLYLEQIQLVITNYKSILDLVGQIVIKN
jgi:hypothetical protein